MESPKYKGDIRKVIIQNVMQNKNLYSLRALLVVSDIERRKYDKELYKTLEKSDYGRSSVLSQIACCSSYEANAINAMIEGFLQGSSSKKESRKP